jgi:sugar lactone lactonase YvrE
MRRRLCLALLCLVVAGCSSKSTSPPPPTPPPFTRLYVTTFDTAPNSLLEVFASPITNASTPVVNVTSAASGLAGPGGMVIDKSGNVYAVNDNAPRNVTIYAQPFTASSTPTTTIVIPVAATNPYTISLDSAGDIWVGDRSGVNSHIYEFTPPFSNASTPALTLTNANGLTDSTGTAFDGAGHMAVAQQSSSNVLIYNVPITAASTPAATFATALHPEGVIFDGAGNLYVTLESGAGGVAVFHPPFSNASTPAFTFGTTVGAFPTFDPSGNLWVPDFSQHVLEYSPPFSAATTAAVTLPVASVSASATGVAFGP